MSKQIKKTPFVKKQVKSIFHLQNKEEDSKQLSIALLKQARQSGILNLSGRGLANVPERVWNIHEPEKDELSARFDMDKSVEEDAWWNQNSLTNLDISSNSLTTISSDIKNLADLRTLNLRNNALIILPKEIGLLENLTKINLSHNKLTELPNEFFRLRELKYLNLSHNNFTEIYPDISDLVMLDTLDLSNNKLTSIPSGIGFLVRLIQFSCSHNKIKELPNDIVNMRILNKLDLIHNELEYLPSSMGELRKLECLYAQHNNIKQLPEFSGCETLKEIHISNNFIKEIQADFCENLPQLKILDLRDNKIEKLPDEIALLQSLIRLDLSNNSINSLPNGLATLANLVSLQLDGNPIRSIRHDIIQSGTNRLMRTLKDRAGKIENSADGPNMNEFSEENLYPDKYKMRKTRALAIPMKNLSEIPNQVFLEAKEAPVIAVNLSKNRFTTLPDGLHHLTDSLFELNMANNLLTNFPKCISQFKNLHYINVSSNGIIDLPPEFGLLATLRELNINNNQLKNISICIYKLKGLEILLARDNNIEEIDATERGLAALPHLTVLDLGNNNIGHVPPILGNLKNINSLELTGNRFRQPRHQVLEKGTDAIMSYLRDRIPI